MIKKLHAALDCGEHKRLIYLIDDTRIKIGCMILHKALAIKAIKAKYAKRPNLLKEYLQKIEDAYEGKEYDIKQLKAKKSLEIDLYLISQGLELESYATHPLSVIRAAVVKQGYNLHLFKNDSDWAVRVAVAEMGGFLEELGQDSHEIVRRTACKLKKGQKN